MLVDLYYQDADSPTLGHFEFGTIEPRVGLEFHATIVGETERWTCHFRIARILYFLVKKPGYDAVLEAAVEPLDTNAYAAIRAIHAEAAAEAEAEAAAEREED